MSPDLEWGVPDWLRPEGYPTPRQAVAVAVWAWEFLRRNERFRAFWVNKVEPFIMADGRIGRDQTGRLWPYYKEMQEFFGILDPWSPRQNSRVPSFCDWATKFVHAPASSYESLPDIAPRSTGLFVNPSKETLSKEIILENAQLQLSWFETGAAIDLRLPLENQLEAIRIIAEEEQLILKRAGLRAYPVDADTHQG